MFDEYEDVIDLVMAVRESEFDCSDFTTITAFTACCQKKWRCSFL